VHKLLVQPLTIKNALKHNDSKEESSLFSIAQCIGRTPEN